MGLTPAADDANDGQPVWWPVGWAEPADSDPKVYI